MIKHVKNLLLENELNYLDVICKDFVETETHSIITQNNHYIRKILDIKKDLTEYQKNCKSLINEEYEIFGLWVNKVTVNTNIDDEYHNDACDLTIITYINDTFDGGEFEYLENKNSFKIKPIRNISLFIDREIRHRVRRITKNERYSLISFYNKKQKKEKTLL
jgi:hypothetical protein